MPEAAQSPPIETCEILLTAEEAYPAFEREFLAAERSILCGFRIFDLDTQLRSDGGRAVGQTWFDLFQHTLGRGVDITLILSDFDPILATQHHRRTWESAQKLSAVDEVAETGRFTFRVAAHPARTGLVPRLFFRAKVREKFQEQQHDIHTPGLAGMSERDLFNLAPATHHQKIAVFDRKRLFIGGLDLNERRYDTTDHDRPSEETWADVQLLVSGTVAESAARHIETFEAVVAGRQKPSAPAPAFLRTLSARRRFGVFHISPRTVVGELEDAHLTAISKATSLIYLETQFLRHQPLADALAMAANRAKDLRLMVVLPAAPEDVVFDGNTGKDARMGEALQADAIAKVQGAFGERALFASPVQPKYSATEGREALAGAPIVYVHSKVSIFDDHTAIVSSANLNGRSMRWDTEAGVQLTELSHVARLRSRMLQHWIPGIKLAELGDLPEAFDSIRGLIFDDTQRTPEARLSRLTPYDPMPAREFGEHQPLAPDELV